MTRNEALNARRRRLKDGFPRAADARVIDGVGWTQTYEVLLSNGRIMRVTAAQHLLTPSFADLVSRLDNR